MREAPAVIEFILKKLKHVEYGCKPDDTAVSRVVVLQKRKMNATMSKVILAG